MIRQLHERWRAYTRRRRALLVGGLSLAALVTVALVALALTRLTPSWWAPVDGEDPRAAARAEKLENALMSHVSLVRPGAEGPPPAGLSFRSEPWAISLREEDANAWLAARLPKWLANQRLDPAIAANLGRVQVSFAGGLVRVGMLLSKDGRDQIIGASARPVLRADGSLWFEGSTLCAGRLDLPASWAAGALRSRAERYFPPGVRGDPEADEALAVIAGSRPLLREAVLRLEDGRRVRLLAITPRDGRVEFTCRTEKK